MTDKKASEINDEQWMGAMIEGDYQKARELSEKRKQEIEAGNPEFIPNLEDLPPEQQAIFKEAMARSGIPANPAYEKTSPLT